MNYNVEDKLFRQQVYWVGGLIVDMLKLEVRLSLIANPDIQEIDGVIIFEECKQFVGQFHDSEEYNPDYIPSLLGIKDTPEATQTRYIITTDTVEISFTSSIEPKAQWKDPERPKETWTWEQTQVWEHSSADSTMPYKSKAAEENTADANLAPE